MYPIAWFDRLSSFFLRALRVLRGVFCLSVSIRRVTDTARACPRKSMAPLRLRGMALFLTVAVLAVLTVLVMALTASIDVARGLSVNARGTAEARELARMGIEAAAARMARGEVWAEPWVIETPEGVARLSPVAPGVGAYDGAFLRPRPGDALVSVEARVAGGLRDWTVRQVYLLNADEGRQRRIRVSETIATVKRKEPPPKPSGRV